MVRFLILGANIRINLHLDEYLDINLNRAVRDHPDIFEQQEFTKFTAGAPLMDKDICQLVAENLPHREETRCIRTDELARKEESMLIRQIQKSHRSKWYTEVRPALALLESPLKK
jgi:hypothetical protein